MRAGETAPRPGIVPELDGIRGIAILLVLVLHVTRAYRELPALSGVERLFARFGQAGWMGVELFFVLSGFLITGILLDTLRAPNYYGAFYARRALRIFPLYYATLAVCFLGVPLVPGAPAAATCSSWYLSYLQNWARLRGCEVPPLNHFWSLAIEEQFYAVWPLAIRALRTPRRVLRASLAIALASALLRLVANVSGADASVVYRLTVTHADPLCIGAALAAAVRIDDARGLLRGFAQLWPSLGVTIAVWILSESGEPYDRVNQAIGFPLFSTFFASLVASAWLGRGSASLIPRAMRWSPLRALGKLAYGLYVFHFPIYEGMLQAISRVRPEVTASRLGTLAVGAAAAMLSGAAAVVSFRWLESPALSLKRFFVATAEGGGSGSAAEMPTVATDLSTQG